MDDTEVELEGVDSRGRHVLPREVKKTARGRTKTDAVTAFLDDLARRGRVPQLAGLTGTIRLELEHDRKVERWLVTCDQGDVSVVRGAGAADCVIRASKAVFAEVASGRLNALSAFLRGVVGVEGDPNVLVLFQRAFPRPSRRRTRPGG